MSTPENLHTGSSIRTFSGIYFDILDLQPEMVNIEDIAHALSMQCRFAGHLPVFYSVAQHSMAVAEMLPPELKLAGLLHDASEAYLLDIPKPIKRHLKDYQELEARVEQLIWSVFGLPFPLPEEIKAADMYQLEFEWQALVIEKGGRWLPMSQWEAKERFLLMFQKLTSGGPGK